MKIAQWFAPDQGIRPVAFIAAILIASLASCGAEGTPPTEDIQGSGSVKPASVLATTEPLNPDFRSRELALKDIGPNEPCPPSTVSKEVPRVALAVGEGPVFAVLGMSEPPPASGGVVHFTNDLAAMHDDLYAVKALWAVSGDHPGPLLLRGRQLDGPGEILFQKAENDPVEPSIELSAGTDDWRYFPSAMFIGQEGCFAIQVDGPEMVQAIVFRAMP